MEQMIISLLPVFLVLTVGIIIRKFNFLDGAFMDGLKMVIIKFALPGVLFMTFAQANLGVENIYIFGLIFLLCAVLFVFGFFLHKVFPTTFPDMYTDVYFTGFEFGMIGVGLFTAIWGMENLPTIAMIAFGHEIFIWFIYVPFLQARKEGQVKIGKVLKDFIKSPTIVGILLGIIVNVAGVYGKIGDTLLGASLINALIMLGNLISPAILIIIGYSMTFKKIPIKKSIILLVTRWVLVLGLGTLVFILIQSLVDVSDFFVKAYYAFIILPPPFVIPILMKSEMEEEIGFFSELLIYYTVLSFVGYVVLMSVL